MKSNLRHVYISGQPHILEPFMIKNNFNNLQMVTKKQFWFKYYGLGLLLYPKICPPIFHARYYPRVSRILNLAQKLTRQILFLRNKSTIRVCYFPKKSESLLYPKIFPPIFLQGLSRIIFNWFKTIQGLHSPNLSKLLVT